MSRLRWRWLRRVVGIAAVIVPTAAQAQDAAPTESLEPEAPRSEASRTEASRTEAGDAEAASRQTPGDWHPGSLSLAMGETLLANFVSWIGAEYVFQWKDITRISPTTWRQNVQAGPVWDDNHLHINWLAHPWQGSHYFVSGRSNGYGYEKSFLFTLVGSALWECCGESHRPSKSDLVTTTLGGSVFGEVLYRLSAKALSRRSTGWSLVAHALTPIRWLTDEALDRPNPAPPGFEPRELPTTWDAFWGLGWNFGHQGIFLELRYTYDDLANVRWGSRPFSHFGASFAMNVRHRSNAPFVQGGQHFVDSFHAAGILWPLYTRQGSPFSFVLTPFQGIDYINKDAYEFGAQTLGLAAAVTFGRVSNWNLALVGDGHGAFGSVASEYAHHGTIHDRREREREYDFTAGGGVGIGAHGGWSTYRATAYYRRSWMPVLDGSNVDGSESSHTVDQVGLKLTASRIVGSVGLAVDWRYFGRTSRFGHSGFTPVIRSSDRQLRAYVTWDTHLQPRSLFLF